MLADLLEVLGLVLRVEQVGLGLGRALLIGVVHQVLDAQEDLRTIEGEFAYLRDGQAGAPVLVLVEDAQAHRPRGVDVGVEKHGRELALGRLVGVVLAELHHELVEASLPGRLTVW